MAFLFKLTTTKYKEMDETTRIQFSATGTTTAIKSEFQ